MNKTLVIVMTPQILQAVFPNLVTLDFVIKLLVDNVHKRLSHQILAVCLQEPLGQDLMIQCVYKGRKYTHTRHTMETGEVGK